MAGEYLVGFLSNEGDQFVLHGAPQGLGGGVDTRTGCVARGVAGAPPVEVLPAAAPLTSVVLTDCGAQDFLAVRALLPGILP